MTDVRGDLEINSPTNMGMVCRWEPPPKTAIPTLGWSEYRLRALSYIEGVLLYGDGYTKYTLGRREGKKRVEFHGTYILALAAKSKHFVEYFNKECAIVLGRSRTKILGPNRDGHFLSMYSSIGFLRWWYHQDLSTLEPLIKKFPVEYL